MIFTRSMSAAANNVKANTRNASKAVNAVNTVNTVNANAKDLKESKDVKKADENTNKANEKLASNQRRAERRRLETLSELSELGAVASAIIETKRQRRQAPHRDLAFYQAFAIQAADAGKRGGLITRSMHRYDYEYNGH